MADQKKPFKVKIKYEDTEAARNLKKSGRVAGGVFKGILKVILTMILVLVITGTLVAGISAIYVMQDVDMEASLDLANIDYNYTTIIYGVNDENQPVEVQRIYANGENRVWVDLENVPEHLRWAFVCTEDKRFYQHNGVDFKRTIYSFANMVLGLSESRQGGSTITQQLIKNITMDNDITIQRKVTEIFRALNLEKHYSKSEILEAYLNVIGLGNGAHGVQSAANMYFDKDVADLTLAQSACLVAVTNNPTAYDPYTHPEENKKRQEYVLKNMLDQGKIDRKTYDAAVKEKIEFSTKNIKQNLSVWNYYVDQVIRDVTDALVEEKGYTREAAKASLFSGGYRIYTPMNVRIQNICEDFYKDIKNFPTFVKNKNGVTQQSAAVILDMKGQMVAVAGGVGKKEGSLVLNRATQSLRPNGSTMKPLGAYGPAMEYDMIHFSTMIEDSPLIDDETGKWPSNWYNSYLKKPITVDYALQRSVNTVATKVCDRLTPKASFNFVTTHLGLPLVKYQKVNGKVFSDMAVAPMAIGALTTGVTPTQLCAAYVPFANGGTYYEPITFNKVLDPNGNVILQKASKGITAFSSDTATVMNRLLQDCVSGPAALAKAAKMRGWEVMGKTGTTENASDLWFVGATPYYCGTVWIGYDQPAVQRSNNYPVNVWQKLMWKAHQGLPKKTFNYDNTVVKEKYCTKTGLLASDSCKSTAVGYYKASNIPGVCTECGHKPAPEKPSEPASQEEASSSETSSVPPDEQPSGEAPTD